jgi:hypothetical protein
VAGVLVLLGALGAYLGLPHHLAELELMTLYPRFAVLVLVLAPLALPRRLSRLAPPLLGALGGPALALAGWYGVQLIRHYRDFSREISDFTSVMDRTPPAGRALGLVYDRSSRVMRVESALVSLPAYYPVLRAAPTSATPVFYCGMRHMPCRVREGAVAPPAPNPWAPTQLDPPKAVQAFDYIFARAAPPPGVLFGKLAGRVEPLARAGSWIVYRVKP